MPEARDRLSRTENAAAVFLRRRERVSGVLVDEPEGSPGLSETPRRRVPTALTGLPMGPSPVMHRRGSFNSPWAGSGRGRNPYRPAGGRENTPLRSARRGRARGSNSVLPSWYPRAPLRDVTAIVRAIERRRARLGDTDRPQVRRPAPQQARMASDESVPLGDVQIEVDNSVVTPKPPPKIKHAPPSTAKLHKILLDITNESTGEQESITPQKKLLNSIDKVEKVVKEELQKLERAPTAKREEREKRMRTLMSMR